MEEITFDEIQDFAAKVYPTRPDSRYVKGIEYSRSRKDFCASDIVFMPQTSPMFYNEIFVLWKKENKLHHMSITTIHHYKENLNLENIEEDEENIIVNMNFEKSSSEREKRIYRLDKSKINLK